MSFCLTASLRTALATALRICLLRVLLRLGFSGIPVNKGGSGLVCLCWATQLVPIQQIRPAILEVWKGKVTADLCVKEVKGQHVPCRFCGGADGDGHLFWDCTFPPLVEIREHPEFHDPWPRCLLWRGWLPLLSEVDGFSLGGESC